MSIQERDIAAEAEKSPFELLLDSATDNFKGTEFYFWVEQPDIPAPESPDYHTYTLFDAATDAIDASVMSPSDLFGHVIAGTQVKPTDLPRPVSTGQEETWDIYLRRLSAVIMAGELARRNPTLAETERARQDGHMRYTNMFLGGPAPEIHTIAKPRLLRKTQ